MEHIYELIAAWIPSVVSIFVGLGIIPILVKLKEYIKAMKENNTLNELAKKVENLSNANKELDRSNRILIDKITKIKNYTENMKDE